MLVVLCWLLVAIHSTILKATQLQVNGQRMDSGEQPAYGCFSCWNKATWQ
uniref:Secreted protein n=1 Tax=Ascaris lumbricoides TaxID=6252 RepID=A0A0M3HME0_ASCLU